MKNLVKINIMYRLMLVFALIGSMTANGQKRATVVEDTAFYMGSRYAVGDTVALMYGSNPNKSFAFISIGGAMTGVTDLESGWAKSDIVINKVYQNGKTVYLRGKLKGTGPNKVFINLEGAIDNKELLPQTQTQTQ